MEERKRSRPYPAEPLNRCIDWIKEARKMYGAGKYDAEMLAIAVGSKSLSGTARRRIAALKHFGLVDFNSGKYSLTDLASRITNPMSCEEESAAIKEAFKTPSLYVELLEKYHQEGRMPDRLPNILLREYEILDGASESAANDFLESARFAKFIDEQGVFIGIVDQPESAIAYPSIATEPELPRQNASPAAHTQDFFFVLTGDKQAQLIVPKDLTPDDCDVLQLQVEMLKQQAAIRARTKSSSALENELV